MKKSENQIWSDEADYICDMLIQMGLGLEIGYCEKDRRISIECTLENAKYIMGLDQFLFDTIKEQVKNEIIEERDESIKEIRKSAELQIAVIKKLTKFDDERVEYTPEYEQKIKKALKDFDLQYPKEC
jgi:hypothetical protein